MPDYSALQPGETVDWVPVGQIDYIWAGKPGTNHPEIVGWYNQFEEFLRREDFRATPTAHTAHSRRMRGYLWDQAKKVYMDMKTEMRNKGSSCIMDGMRNPLRVILMPKGDLYLPRMGNQRLCVLRAWNYGDPPCSCHDGLVPCVVLPK